MKKLPEIFKNDFNKKIVNNDTTYDCTTSESIEKENIDVKKFLDELFKERGYIFNKPLIIKTKAKTYDTAIIRKTIDTIYTLSEDEINIDDIISIKKK